LELAVDAPVNNGSQSRNRATLLGNYTNNWFLLFWAK